MKITTEQLPNCQIALTVEPEQERVDEALKKAARKVSQKYTVPGYRKGKAPYAAVVRAYGKEALYEQVVDDLGDQVYREALEQSELEPIAPGELKDVTFDPLVFHLVLSMPPVVDLKDYRDLRVDRPEVTVDEEEVDKEIERLQEANADWIPVEDGGAQYGDLVTMNLVATSGDEEIVNDEAFEVELDEENDAFPPGFDASFIDATADAGFSFDLDYPEDWHSARAGSTAHFEATVLSVKRKELPALDDDFAPLVGDFDTLEDLKASIRDGIKEEKQTEADNQYANTVIEKIIEGGQIDYPEVLLEDYTERSVREQTSMISRLGIPFNEYLRLVGRTEAQFRAEAMEGARKQLLSDLVLEKLISEEYLQPSEEAISERVEEIISNETEDVEGLRGLLEFEGGRHAIMHELERRYAVERMMAIADGTAPSLEEVKTEADARAAAAEAAAAEEPETEPAEQVDEPVASEEPTVAVES